MEEAKISSTLAGRTTTGTGWNLNCLTFSLIYGDVSEKCMNVWNRLLIAVCLIPSIFLTYLKLISGVGGAANTPLSWRLSADDLKRVDLRVRALVYPHRCEVVGNLKASFYTRLE